jgi:hypothetical protein
MTGIGKSEGRLQPFAGIQVNTIVTESVARNAIHIELAFWQRLTIVMSQGHLL